MYDRACGCARVPVCERTLVITYMCARVCMTERVGVRVCLCVWSRCRWSWEECEQETWVVLGVESGDDDDFDINRGRVCGSVMSGSL